MADIIFCHFGTFSALLSHETPKNQNFEKMKKKKKKRKKKTPEVLIILHKCTKNHDHMMYHF